MPTLTGLCGIAYDPVKEVDGIDLTEIIRGRKKPFDRYIFSRQGNQVTRKLQQLLEE